MGSSSSKYPPSRQIQTSYGPVIGRRLIHEGDHQVDAFQGVPFAKPPLGHLRFRKPVAPDPWTEPLQCTAFGPRGVQKDMFFFVKWQQGPTSESNLFLNVFSPVWEPPPDGFPVMVFVHGGGFVSDSAVKYGDIGICRAMVTKGVVVVTIQYRLGFLGFWSTGDDECDDNVGLWDQTFALEWVRDNIKAFAGDPNNVTLFGQSAGGASVDLLSLSPHSRDLFHKVIPIAGNASCAWALCGDAVEACREHANHLGIDEGGDSAEYIERLRNVDAAKFGLGLVIEGPTSGKAVGLKIGPRLDGQFFPKSLNELRQEAPKKPRMIGCCEEEGIVMTLTLSEYTVTTIEKMIAFLIPESVPEFKKHRIEMLNTLLVEKHDKKKITRATVELLSDLFLNIGCQRAVVDWLNAGQEEVYFYSFEHYNPKMFGPLAWKMPYKAATHCTEMSFLFAVGILWPFDLNDEDKEVLDHTTTLFTNFAKYGDPNGPPDSRVHPQWDPATKEHPQRHFVISRTAAMKETYHDGRPARWVEILSQK